MDIRYMEMALEQAKLGEGRVNPNPLVGAVLVKNNKVIGMGHHEIFGGAHAEINAFNSAANNGYSAEGSTLYVTLEPCCHYGKTPPCTDAIILNKVSRVIIGTLDPNPMVSGKGVEVLARSGIEVRVGMLEEECKKINQIFMKHITTHEPYVLMKVAMSLDGKIATKTGNSKWISSEVSRLEVHNLRNKYMGIMVGIGTVMEDNPELTCRISGGRNPVRIVVDSSLRVKVDSKVVISAKETRTIIATTENASIEKIELLEKLGVDILVTSSKDGKVNLPELMTKLGELGIDSVLLEGGGTLNFSALEEGIVDKVKFYIAPIVIGGQSAKTPVGGDGVEFVANAFKLNHMSSRQVGYDICITGYLK